MKSAGYNLGFREIVGECFGGDIPSVNSADDLGARLASPPAAPAPAAEQIKRSN